jgi:hypothetical protein
MRASGANHTRVALVCLVVGLAAAVPAQASWSGRPPGRNCVWETRGAEQVAPSNLKSVFYKRPITLLASVDGLDGQELSISIEAVCDLPEKLARGAAGLPGSDGIALRLHRTTVWEGHALKVGPSATALIKGADTVLMRGRFARPRAWRHDERGSRIATFRAGRMVVMD